MTNPNGFLNFNIPEDYLAYQDQLITNWQRYHQYKSLTGGTMLSETYRHTGRTYSALKCAVDLAMRPDTSSVLFITHKHRAISNFRHYSFFENYAHQHFPYDYTETGKIKFVSYDGLERHLLGATPEPDYVIYDHMVFETCVPGSIARNRVKTPAEEAYKKLHGMYPNHFGESFTDWEIFEEAFNLGLKEASK